jgi:hypothetical protein
MTVCVRRVGEPLPCAHRDTVAVDTSTILAMSFPCSPPRERRSSRILATAVLINFTDDVPRRPSTLPCDVAALRSCPWRQSPMMGEITFRFHGSQVMKSFCNQRKYEFIPTSATSARFQRRLWRDAFRAVDHHTRGRRKSGSFAIYRAARRHAKHQGRSRQSPAAPAPRLPQRLFNQLVVSRGILIFEDLGSDLTSLADLLLKGSADDAERALASYAQALGRVQPDYSPKYFSAIWMPSSYMLWNLPWNCSPRLVLREANSVTCAIGTSRRRSSASISVVDPTSINPSRS